MNDILRLKLTYLRKHYIANIVPIEEFRFEKDITYRWQTIEKGENFISIDHARNTYGKNKVIILRGWTEKQINFAWKNDKHDVRFNLTRDWKEANDYERQRKEAYDSNN